jgi:phosphomannomutase
MKNVFLFDLDGTLCESRKSVTKEIVDILKTANTTLEIGILTGSDMDFLKEQCRVLFESIGYENKVYAMACNGTKSYEVIKTASGVIDYSLIKEENLRERIGEDKFKIVMRELIYEQTESMIDYDFPLTGNFVTHRGSTINWCPVGRCANDADRAAFKKEDKAKGIRKHHVENIKRAFVENGVDGLIINVAGDTSFDIYPVGWDKTYAIQFFKDYDIYFWGDRMEEGGNDYTMHCRKDVKSFPVEDPEETVVSVKEQLDRINKNQETNKELKDEKDDS